jgi:hypothetical protein
VAGFFLGRESRESRFDLERAQFNRFGDGFPCAAVPWMPFTMTSANEAQDLVAWVWTESIDVLLAQHARKNMPEGRRVILHCMP